jgi:hypothetical protein
VSSNNPPVGPSSGRVASRIAIAAPCSGVWVPLNVLRSVATYPGQALMRTFVSLSAREPAPGLLTSRHDVPVYSGEIIAET